MLRDCAKAIAIWLAVLFPVGCRSAPLTAPTPTPLPTSSSIFPTPTPRSLVQALQGDSGPAELVLAEGMVLHLPADWRYVTRPAAHGYPLPADLQGAMWIAWKDGPEFVNAPVRLSSVRTARSGLSLPAYADAVVTALTESGMQSVTSTITTTLRADGLPAAEIIYSTNDPGAAQQRGFQVALFDETGDNLVLLTAVAPAERWSAVRPELEQLVFGIGIK